jgi:hypothetical protein
MIRQAKFSLMPVRFDITKHKNNEHLFHGD